MYKALLSLFKPLIEQLVTIYKPLIKDAFLVGGFHYRSNLLFRYSFVLDLTSLLVLYIFPCVLCVMSELMIILNCLL